MITYKQLSLADIFSDCQNKFDNNKYEFLSILDESIILYISHLFYRQIILSALFLCNKILFRINISLKSGSVGFFPIGIKISNLFRNYLFVNISFCIYN